MSFRILQSSIWFLPSLLTALSILGSFALINIDLYYFSKVKASPIWLFRVSDEGVRELLSTIATALITIVSISFSITIIAVQQAANQYSPRVVRTFTSDKGNQFVLGMYLATFIFVIMVLRQVGGPHNFIPIVSIGVSIFLTLFCLGLLIFFIHRMVNSLQVIRIVQRIHHDLLRGFDLLFPDKIEAGEAEPQSLDEIMKKEPASGKGFKLRSGRYGFLNRISKHKLAQINDPDIRWICVPVKIGDFILYGQVLAEIDHYDGGNTRLEKMIRSAFEFGDRTIESDPLYGIGQLIDISLRALSPALNAPANAEYALYHLGNALSVLAERRVHEIPMSVPRNPIRFFLNSHSWNEFIHFSFDQIRRNSQQEIRITALAINIIHHLADRIVSRDRARVLSEELSEIRAAVERGAYLDEEKILLIENIDQANKKISDRLKSV
jgi:uncharacterized membrane protein